MQNNELTVEQRSVATFNWKKNLLFKILSKLKHGNITIVENGDVVGSFGEIHTDLKANVIVHNDKFYSSLLFYGSIGAGESYVAGDWSSPDLTKVVQVFARNLHILDKIEEKMGWLTMPLNKLTHYRNRNSLGRAKENISSHYDLGNKLYESFLDASMLYSSAIYKNDNDTIESAQQNKLKSICDKLQLNESDHVLEIGTGWGALAIYMAKNYGCHVTTTTISEEQYAYTKKLIEESKLQNKITLLKKDYRLLSGQFDKLVSVEMIEAVGKDYMSSFFKICQNLLKPDGMMLLQSITIADQRMKIYSNSVDFIQKHVFPGGFLPSLKMINEEVTRNTHMAVRDVHDIGLDYAKTLNHWRLKFEDNFDTIKPYGYDQRFFRLWKFYLQYCEAGFLERTISTVQVVLTAKGHRHDLQLRK